MTADAASSLPADGYYLAGTVPVLVRSAGGRRVLLMLDLHGNVLREVPPEQVGPLRSVERHTWLVMIGDLSGR